MPIAVRSECNEPPTNGGRPGTKLFTQVFLKRLKRTHLDQWILDAFIEDPDAVVPGHNMKPFSGIAEAETRATIVEALSDG